MNRPRWFKHPRHGYMLRFSHAPGWDTVVTALVLDALEYQADASTWEAHKFRLRVNAGCGAIACSEMRAGDHNPDFKPVRASTVPAWVKADFLPLVDPGGES